MNSTCTSKETHAVEKNHDDSTGTFLKPLKKLYDEEPETEVHTFKENDRIMEVQITLMIAENAKDI